MQESWPRLHGWRRRRWRLGVVVLEVWGLGEGGLDEKQLPQDGRVWSENFFLFFFFLGVTSAMALLCSRPGLCSKPGTAFFLGGD